MSGCKLLHIGWINNKVQLYSTGNYIQYPMVNCNGKEYEKEHIYIYTYTHILYICVCIYESLYSTNQHCKSPMCACVLKLLQSCLQPCGL